MDQNYLEGLNICKQLSLSLRSCVAVGLGYGLKMYISDTLPADAAGPRTTLCQLLT